MGMIASYQMIDDPKIGQLLSKDEDDIYGEIDAVLEETQDDPDEVIDIDKLWDGLHFLLTGVSACEPTEGDPISEAIVGTAKIIEDEDETFAYVRRERVSVIAEALNGIDIDALIEDFQPVKFEQSGIYPDGWQDEDREELQRSLKECFIGLKKFYDMTADKKKGIIISVCY